MTRFESEFNKKVMSFNELWQLDDMTLNDVETAGKIKIPEEHKTKTEEPTALSHEKVSEIVDLVLEMRQESHLQKIQTGDLIDKGTPKKTIPIHKEFPRGNVNELRPNKKNKNRKNRSRLRGWDPGHHNAVIVESVEGMDPPIKEKPVWDLWPETEDNGQKSSSMGKWNEKRHKDTPITEGGSSMPESRRRGENPNHDDIKANIQFSLPDGEIIEMGNTNYSDSYTLQNVPESDRRPVRSSSGFKRHPPVDIPMGHLPMMQK